MYPWQSMSWRHYLLGVAPGEPGQASAISVVEQVIVVDRDGVHQTTQLNQSHLEQVPGGTSLPALAQRIGDLHAMLARGEQSAAKPALIVDIAMLGHLLPSLLWKLDPARLMVTNGTEESVSDNGTHLRPRRELATGLLHATQVGLFRTAGTLELAPRFAHALQNFRYRPLTRFDDELEAMRREADDDLVIAAALCVWQAGRFVPGPMGMTTRVTGANRDPLDAL
jgi:hypothetical protein